MGWLAGCCQWRAPRCRAAGTYTGEAAANLRTAVVEGAGGCSGQNTRWAKGTKPSLCRPRLSCPQRDLCEAHLERARACS